MKFNQIHITGFNSVVQTMCMSETESSLIQIITCSPFNSKPLTKPITIYCLLDPHEQTLIKCEENTKVIFVQENAIKNVIYCSGLSVSILLLWKLFVCTWTQ